MTLNKHSVELLAPAGSYETFLAAIDAEQTQFISAENILICASTTYRHLISAMRK